MTDCDEGRLLLRRRIGGGLAAALLLAGWAQAQPLRVDEGYLLDRWSTADGLPVGDTSVVRIAGSGYLWLATYDGLARFDGHRFVVFNTSREPGLPGNRLTSLNETPDGQLWMATEQSSAARFDGVTFETLGLEHGLPHPQVLTSHVDRSGSLWLGTRQGLARREGERFVTWAPDAIAGEVLGILARPDGRVWVGTADDGLYELDGEVVRRRWTEGDGLPSNRVRALSVDPSGRLWIGTSAGLTRLHNDSLEPLPELDGESVEIVEALADGSVHLLTSARRYRWDQGRFEPGRRGTARLVRTVGIAPDGAVWTVDQTAVARNGREVLEAPCVISSFDFDATGAVWLATACDGLWRLREREVVAVGAGQGLPPGPVYGLAETPDGTLWATTAEGTVSEILDGRAVGVHGTSTGGQPLRTLLARPDGTLWVGHRGLCILAGGTCVRPEDVPEALLEAEIRALDGTPDGVLWVGSTSGLWRRDQRGWQRMDEALALEPWNLVRGILRAGSGNLWLATAGDGLRRLDRDGRVVAFSQEHGLSSSAVRDLHEDHRGHLWAATEDRGLCRSRTPEHDPEMRFDCLGEPHGLHSASLHRILADDLGRLWLNSNHGVFWIEQDALERVLEGGATRVFPHVYTERDGLPSREGNGGVQGAGLRLADGRLAFPGQGGIAIFDPRRVGAEPRPPRVVVESLLLPGGRALPHWEAVALPRGERIFSIRFTGLTPGLTDPHFFRYRLRPGAEEWTDLGTDRVLSFERLPAGRYTLELVGLDAASGATGPVTRVELELPAYLHETLPFRLGLVLAVAVLAALALWWRLRQAALRHRRLEEEVDRRTAALRRQHQATEVALGTVRRQRKEIETLAEARRRFFANVSHELRTPLTLLVGPLEDLAAGDPPSAELATGMVRSARRLERLVGQLLDLERIDARRLPLRLAPVELAGLARESAAAFAPLAEREGIGLELSLPDAPVPVTADLDQIGRVLGNLLSNALKFTPGGGRVHLGLGLGQSGPGEAQSGAGNESGEISGGGSTRGSATLFVEDTGPGVLPEWQERIFDRFAQMGSEATRGREGAGLGLALCREVVALHGGSLHVEPAATGGARFVLRLPLAPALAELDREGAMAGAGPAEEAAASERIHNPGANAPAGPENGNPRQPGALALPSSRRQTKSSPTPKRGQRILVAEDHPDLRRYIEGVLAARYRVEAVEDGEAALAAIWREPPDAVVSDVVMPRRDGFGLARALRAEPELAGIPLIFLTARASERDEIEGLAIGADQYLRKPFSSEVLLAHVEAAIRACQRLREQLSRRPGAFEPGDGPEPENLPGRVRAWIEANAHQESLSVDELAAALYMSRATLRRKLLAATGMPPSDYIRTVRLLRARSLLEEGAGTVSEVAYAVGFNSLSAFSRAYRSHYGEPPSQSLQ